MVQLRVCDKASREQKMRQLHAGVFTHANKRMHASRCAVRIATYLCAIVLGIAQDFACVASHHDIGVEQTQHVS